jgi:hypothetical protein
MYQPMTIDRSWLTVPVAARLSERQVAARRDRHLSAKTIRYWTLLELRHSDSDLLFKTDPPVAPEDLR